MPRRRRCRLRRAHADLAALEAAARKEGSLTWYTAQMSGEAAEDMGRIFTRKYPGISVTVIRTTGQVAYQRVLQELKNSTPQCDVFCSTDMSHYPALKARNALAKYAPQNAGALAPPFVGFGDPDYYIPATASLQIMVYHTKSVKPEDVPKNWTDLVDPKWKNRVAVAHPAFSGYFGTWVLAMRKLYGWEFFEKLAKNNPRIGRSGNDPIAMLNAGESLIGTGPVSTSVQNIEKGNPDRLHLSDRRHAVVLRPRLGDGGRAASQCGAAVPRMAAERGLRASLCEVASGAGARRCAADAGHQDAVGDQAAPLTPAEIAKGIPEVIEQWRDTFGS